MATNALIGIPVKPFGIAKRRLSGHLSAVHRSVLGKAIAARTAHCATDFGEVVIVTGDDSVMRWAVELGHGVLDEASGAGCGLDRAASAVSKAAAALERPWLVLHADLPLVVPGDVGRLATALSARSAVIAPSHDGGTAAVGWFHDVTFSYGPGSFHRHLRQVPAATVVSSPGLAFDLDTAADLKRARAAAPWIDATLAAIDSPS